MKRINIVISTLIFSDLILFFALGLLTPIYGIFILEHIEGSSLEVIGTATSVFWIARVASVIPISRKLDKLKGEKDEYFAVLTGTFAMALLPLLYIFATKPVHIYLIELCKGTATALAVPAWRILFTKFVDRQLIGYEWSFEDACVGIATAASAIIGAVIADMFGFKILFCMVSAMGIIAALFLTRLYKEKRIKTSQNNILQLLFQDTTSESAPLKIDTIK